jgi:hypothetical protein
MPEAATKWNDLRLFIDGDQTISSYHSHHRSPRVTIGHEVTSAIIYMLEKEFPYLSLCSNHWKAKHVIAGRYRFWAKMQGLAENGNGSDVDSDNECAVGSKHKARAGTVPRKRQKPAVVPPGESAVFIFFFLSYFDRTILCVLVHPSTTPVCTAAHEPNSPGTSSRTGT